MTIPYFRAPLEHETLAPRALKHIKGDWRKYIDCCRWVAAAEDLLSTAIMRFELAAPRGCRYSDSAGVSSRRARALWLLRLSLSRDKDQQASYEEIEAYNNLHLVETVIVTKLRNIDAAITLQTAWRARQGRGQLVLFRALREIDLRLSRARYAEVVRATQVVQTAWGEYKCNKRLKVMRREHFLSLAIVRQRSARIIQQAWFGYARAIKAEVDAFRRAVGRWMCERGDCRKLSSDDARLLFASLVGM